MVVGKDETSDEMTQIDLDTQKTEGITMSQSDTTTGRQGILRTDGDRETMTSLFDMTIDHRLYAEGREILMSRRCGMKIEVDLSVATVPSRQWEEATIGDEVAVR